MENPIDLRAHPITQYSRIITIEYYNSLTDYDKTKCIPLKEYGQNDVKIWAYQQFLKNIGE